MPTADPPPATACPATAAAAPQPRRWWRDVRIPFAGLLGLYVLLGITVLGFNRHLDQVAIILVTCLLTDLCFNRWYRGAGWQFPWSGLISGLGLCLLLNVGAGPWLALLPAFACIASKHLVTFEGRHVYNPSMVGVVLGVWLGGGMVSPAPAYQWGGSIAITLFVVTAALMVFAFKIRRTALIVAFLGFYTLQMVLRAYVLRHHLPMDAIILGTYTSAPFFLFVFYMITDPKTSPSRPRDQVLLAFAVTLVDLWLHTRQTYSTLFLALFIVQTAIWIGKHARRIWQTSPRAWWRDRHVDGWLLARALPLGAVLVLLAGMTRRPPATTEPGFRFEEVPETVSGLHEELGTVLTDLDPRVQHIAKWILSVGDAAAVADVNADGLPDLFLTRPMKRPEDRAALYLNRGDLTFERVDLPALATAVQDPARYGLPAVGVFADYDNDGDQDLFIGMGFGRNILLQNVLYDTGHLAFRDVTEAAGIRGHSSSVAAVWADVDADGHLDLLVANAAPTHLPDYPEPKPAFTPFALPQPAYPGDRRMYHFMHSSWKNAANGGRNQLYRNRGDGSFEAMDMTRAGMTETHWTLAVNAADLNQDGRVDFYCASDFGPDDLYLNLGDWRFQRLRGPLFGDIGRDTYKGMNCSVFDADGDGWQDVYVSNVHHPLQAEGSLLWRIHPDARAHGGIAIDNEATKRGALNERRFGWGAAAGDLDLDGWPDLVQANGMVDDSMDRRFDRPRDYWYVNEKLARTGPEVHAYADRWGDIRGYSIWGLEGQRVLLNRGGRFVETAPLVGLGEPRNARGAALADFDNDGDLDLLFTRQFAPAQLYRNSRRQDAAATSHYLGLRLIGGGTVARDGLNARISLRGADGRLQVQEAVNVSGFSSQDDGRLLFGLAADATAVDIHVRWPDGLEVAVTNLAVDCYHDIRHPAARDLLIPQATETSQLALPQVIP